VNTVNTRPSINNLNRSLSTSSLKRVTTVSRMKDWEHNLDPVQKKLLEEECIVLDNKDKVIGHDSKKNCHLVRDNGDVLLHRAFSVFLFNSKGNWRSTLLLQFWNRWNIYIWKCNNECLFCMNSRRTSSPAKVQDKDNVSRNVDKYLLQSSVVHS